MKYLRMLFYENNELSKEGVTAEQKTNVELMYKAYHQLGGNGIVTNVYQHIMDMPLVGESNDQNDYHPL